MRDLPALLQSLDPGAGLDRLMKPPPGVATARPLLPHMGLVRQDRRSPRALVASNPSQPAAERTDYVLHSLTLPGPGVLFAAVTGILLFASSIIAGRVEWWCVACIPLIGALNPGVSFYCASRLALLSHKVGRLDRARMRSAIWSRVRRRPLDFLWPATPAPAAAPTAP